jgi:beta-lactamase regulating signal transducer with metallopeptidase domain/N-acetylneuraminic acid mutarotase
MRPLAEFADGFCQLLWRNSWQVSILILLVLVANWALRRKLAHGWRYALWLLVIVRLACPFPPPSPLSLFNLFARNGEPANSASTTSGALKSSEAVIPTPAPTDASDVAVFDKEAPAIAGESVVARAESISAVPATAAARPFPTALILFLTWLAGVLILGARIAWEAVKLGNSIRRLRPTTTPFVLDLLEDCKESMKVTTPVVVIESAQVQSPMLHGFLRPRLLLPEGLMARLGHEQLRHVFLHELAHVRYCDILVNWLATWLQILHWFNPLVWLAFWCMRNERELTADRLALLSVKANERLEYGETLLMLVRLFRSRRFLPSLAGILEVKGQIESRITEIANFQTASGRPALAIALLTVLGIVTLTDAHVSRREIESKELQANTGTWRRCANAPHSFAPAARVGHSAVWTGTELIVWGGRQGGTYLDDGARYDVATDAWRPLSRSNAPSPRWLHAAVWTGKELIVWGGRTAFDNFEVRSDGARYNPATDTWTPLSIIAAPRARSQMAAVWTGTEMLIWGGAGEGWGVERLGARYDPRTDTWDSLSEKEAPEPRMEPTAVWSGNEMLVWGGVRYAPDQITFGTGGRYDPRRNSWTLLPTNGAPSARTGHTAVWTGSEMVVWGGGEDVEYMNTGARFNIATGAWLPTTLKDAPQQRLGHCALWTGAEMIVCGGVTAARNITFAACRYDPVADTWTHVTNIGAPAARYFHRSEGAVWTGQGMLVFGGSIITRELDTAFLWTPPPDATR